MFFVRNEDISTLKCLSKTCNFKKTLYLCTAFERRCDFAEIAQLVEHDLAKVGVASSSLVFRSLN